MCATVHMRYFLDIFPSFRCSREIAEWDSHLFPPTHTPLHSVFLTQCRHHQNYSLAHQCTLQALVSARNSYVHERSLTTPCSLSHATELTVTFLSSILRSLHFFLPFTSMCICTEKNSTVLTCSSCWQSPDQLYALSG